MKTKPTLPRINIKISKKAYRALSKKAHGTGRTMLVMLDLIMGV